jgi:4-amino-4-deoxy-L-arabinose transferase-like glycosyltransferase
MWNGLMNLILNFLKNRKLLWVVLLSVLMGLVHIVFCIDIYYDIAARYAPMTREFARFNWSGAFDVRYSVVVSALGGLIALTGLNGFSSIVASSSIFYVLAIFPLYYILKRIFKDRTDLAVLGCLLYVTAPKIIRWGCTGLLNSGRNFFMISAVALLLSYFDDRKWYKALLLGGALAGLCMVRGEGIAYLPFFFLAACFMYFKREKKVSGKVLIGLMRPVSLCVVGLLICFTPRVIQLYRNTGIPALEKRQTTFVKALLAKDSKEKDKLYFVSSIDTAQRETGMFGVERISEFFRSFGRGSYELYLIFAGIGLLLMIRKKKFHPDLYLLLSLSIFNALLFLFTNLSQRYFSINILLFMPFTVTAVYFVYESAAKFKLKPVAVIGLLVVLGMQLNNGMEQAFERNDAYLYYTGLWIKQYRDKLSDSSSRLKIMSDKPQIAFWADADWVDLSEKQGTIIPSKDEIRKRGIDLIIVDLDNKKILRQVLSRNDLKVFLHPNSNKTAMFVPR